MGLAIKHHAVAACCVRVTQPGKDTSGTNYRKSYLIHLLVFLQQHKASHNTQQRQLNDLGKPRTKFLNLSHLLFPFIYYMFISNSWQVRWSRVVYFGIFLFLCTWPFFKTKPIAIGSSSSPPLPAPAKLR